MDDWRTAFSELVRMRGSALMRYAYLLCGDAVQASDLVQDALLKTFGRARPVRRDLDRLEGYVRRTILNLHIDECRRQGRWRAKQHLVATAEQRADTQDEVANTLLVRSSLAALTPMQRASIILRFYQDLSIEEIAEELGCSTGNTKRHLSDARTRLFAALQETGRGTA